MEEAGETEDRIARVMLEARKSADLMVNKAKEDTAAIIGESTQKLRELSGKASDFGEEIAALQAKFKCFYEVSGSLLEGVRGMAAELGRRFLEIGDAPEGEDASQNLPPVKTEMQSDKAAGGPNFNFAGEKKPSDSQK